MPNNEYVKNSEPQKNNKKLDLAKHSKTIMMVVAGLIVAVVIVFGFMFIKNKLGKKVSDKAQDQTPTTPKTVRKEELPKNTKVPGTVTQEISDKLTLVRVGGTVEEINEDGKKYTIKSEDGATIVGSFSERTLIGDGWVELFEGTDKIAKSTYDIIPAEALSDKVSTGSTVLVSYNSKESKPEDGEVVFQEFVVMN